jgi:phage baseplate assembly protein W
MSDDEAIFGQDLDLGLTADEEGRTFAGPQTEGDLQAVRRADVAPRATDLASASGRRNLVQSLVLRLMTERGELAGLGHPDYGSRHHRLVGEPNTERNRALLRLYVLECVRQEPRVETVAAIDVRPAGRAAVKIELAVRPRGEAYPLNLVVPFTFSGARR